MTWRYICILGLMLVREEHCQLSPDSGNNGSNKIAIIVTLLSANDSGNADWIPLNEILKETNVSVLTAALPANQTGNSTKIELLWQKDLNVSLTIADVTDDLIVGNITDVDESLLNSSRSINDTASFAFINPCSIIREKRNETLRQLFSLINGSFYGFYIDLARKPANATSGFVGNLSAEMDTNRSYFISITDPSPINASLFVNVTTRLCWKLVRGPGSRSRKNNATSTPGVLCGNGTGNATVLCTNESAIANTTSSYPNGTGAPTATTTSVTTAGRKVSWKNNTGTELVVTPMSYGHSGTSAGLVVILVIVVVGIAMMLFRRKIADFVRRKLRTREADNQTTSIRYGSLRGGDEFDLDVLSRRDAPFS